MNLRRGLLLLIMAAAIVGASRGFLRVDEAVSSDIERASLGVAEVPPGPILKTADELIAFWRERYERDPRDYISLTYQGQAHVRKARDTGALAEYARAEETLGRALNLNATYEPALAYMSAVLLAQHDFHGALGLAERIYTFDRGALQALATVGDAHIELGNYAQAEAAYRELAARSPSPPVYSRLARLAWLHGDRERALRHAQQATNEAATWGLTGERRAWYELQLADLYFDSGQPDIADVHFAAALQQAPDYALALGGLADMRATQGRYEEAIELYTRTLSIAPQPHILAALGDLHVLTGDRQAAQRYYAEVESIARRSAVSDRAYNRELTMFYADHDVKVVKALQRARVEMDRRQDIYGYDTLAWTLYKNARIEEASEVMRDALKPGTQDATLYFHAGVISFHLGEIDTAQRQLELAMRLNPNFIPLLYGEDVKQALSLLDDDRTTHRITRLTTAKPTG